jgi:hypothetical protein
MNSEENNEEKFGTVQNYDCGIFGVVLGKDKKQIQF